MTGQQQGQHGRHHTEVRLQRLLFKIGHRNLSFTNLKCWCSKNFSGWNKLSWISEASTVEFEIYMIRYDIWYDRCLHLKMEAISQQQLLGTALRTAPWKGHDCKTFHARVFHHFLGDAGSIVKIQNLFPANCISREMGPGSFQQSISTTSCHVLFHPSLLHPFIFHPSVVIANGSVGFEPPCMTQGHMEDYGSLFLGARPRKAQYVNIMDKMTFMMDCQGVLSLPSSSWMKTYRDIPMNTKSFLKCKDTAKADLHRYAK